MIQKRTLLFVFLTTLTSALTGRLEAAVSPPDLFVGTQPFKPANRIDHLAVTAQAKHGLRPANLCSDAVFVRRVYMDVIGTLPTSAEVHRFLGNSAPDKRSALIEELMRRDEFADYWTMKWCDLLRVKAEFPINLWPNGVQAYARWIHDAIRDNMPYDEFVRALLTSSGSNFRVPPVNFYRAIQGDEASPIANAVALTFLGTRTEGWPTSKQNGFSALFSRVAFKNTAEWKEVIVFQNPAPTNTFSAMLPDGETIRVGPDQDPRVLFADWLLSDGNQWLCRAIVNRTWAWLLGRGLIHETDDIRPDNPPSLPAVLTFLENELVRHDYNLRHIYRLILNSSVYQQASVPKSESSLNAALFTHYPVRQLDAEVLADALNWIAGRGETYSSAVPEPFTFIPNTKRSIELVDGSITSPFLKKFGRPARDTGAATERRNAPTKEQRLHMLNSTHVRNKIEKSWRIDSVLRNAKGDRDKLIRSLFVLVLSRPPTRSEIDIAKDYYGGDKRSKQTSIDLLWALINSKEFLFRH